MVERDPFNHDQDPSANPEIPITALMGDPRQIFDDDRIPPGYSHFRRDVQLLNGNWEPAFYSTRRDLPIDSEAWDRSSGSIIDGFMWALQTPDFADHETADDDRTQEIGNMMSYALTCGLTDEQVLRCYELAFNAAKKFPK